MRAAEGAILSKHAPPVAPSQLADFDTTFLADILDVPQRQPEVDEKHHRQTVDLWADLAAAERGTIGHVVGLAGGSDRLKPSSSGNTAGKTPDKLVDALKPMHRGVSTAISMVPKPTKVNRLIARGSYWQ